MYIYIIIYIYKYRVYIINILTNRHQIGIAQTCLGFSTLPVDQQKLKVHKPGLQLVHRQLVGGDCGRCAAEASQSGWMKQLSNFRVACGCAKVNWWFRYINNW